MCGGTSAKLNTRTEKVELAFAVGDRVRVTEDGAYGATVQAGDLGTVKKVEVYYGDQEYGVEMDERRVGYAPHSSEDYDWLFLEKHLEKVEEESLPMQRPAPLLAQLPEWLHTHTFARVENIDEADYNDPVNYRDHEHQVDPADANVFTSHDLDPRSQAFGLKAFSYRLALDIDLPVWTRETSPGKHHVVIDHLLTKEQHDRVLTVLRDVGILEHGFVERGLQSDYGTALRVPWVRKRAGAGIEEPDRF